MTLSPSTTHCTAQASSKLITPLPQPFSFIPQSFSASLASSCHTLLNRCTCTHLTPILPSSPASCAFFSEEEEEEEEAEAMVRGGSSGGGQSSLGYLFGSDAGPPKAVARAPAAAPTPAPVEQRAAGFARSNAPEEKPAAAAVGAPAHKVEDAGTSLDMGAAKLGRNSNNYHRADGQNNGNFITDRPSTKVHAAPGGGSSLGYLFGGS